MRASFVLRREAAKQRPQEKAMHAHFTHAHITKHRCAYSHTFTACTVIWPDRDLQVVTLRKKGFHFRLSPHLASVWLQLIHNIRRQICCLENHICVCQKSGRYCAVSLMMTSVSPVFVGGKKTTVVLYRDSWQVCHLHFAEG